MANLPNPDIKVVKGYQNIMTSANSRSLEFNVSFAEFKRIYNSKHCYYTGVKLIHGANGNFSFDRVDNTLGYISGNLVACDSRFNQAKSSLSLEQIRLLTLGLAKFYSKKQK